ncbi:hypothetical protein J4Q44_G00004420 [Coregonus suidteri]|uniref:Uncharacterized protein n=1 Tax=Coregonus suidteri TaxID=861788 RepID=A0AAN8MCX8_9TELE
MLVGIQQWKCVRHHTHKHFNSALGPSFDIHCCSPDSLSFSLITPLSLSLPSFPSLSHSPLSPFKQEKKEEMKASTDQ